MIILAQFQIWHDTHGEFVDLTKVISGKYA